MLKKVIASILAITSIGCATTQTPSKQSNSHVKLNHPVNYGEDMFFEMEFYKMPADEKGQTVEVLDYKLTVPPIPNIYPGKVYSIDEIDRKKGYVWRAQEDSIFISANSTLYLKWRIKGTDKIFERTIDFAPVLSQVHMDDTNTIQGIIQGNKVAIYMRSLYKHLDPKDCSLHNGALSDHECFAVLTIYQDGDIYIPARKMYINNGPNKPLTQDIVPAFIAKKPQDIQQHINWYNSFKDVTSEEYQNFERNIRPKDEELLQRIRNGH